MAVGASGALQAGEGGPGASQPELGGPVMGGGQSGVENLKANVRFESSLINH